MREVRELAFDVWKRNLGAGGRVQRIKNPMTSGGHVGAIADGFVNLALRPITWPISLPFRLMGKAASMFFSFRDTLLCFHPDYVKTGSPSVLAVTDDRGRLRLPSIPSLFGNGWTWEKMNSALESLGVREGKLVWLGMDDLFDGENAGKVDVLMRGKIGSLAQNARWVLWNELTQPGNPYSAFHAAIKQFWDEHPTGFAWLSEWHRMPYNVGVEE